QRNSFSSALEAGRRMAAMSQDITPRKIYGNQGSSRSSMVSSISSTCYNTPYYNGSVAESSVTDCTSTSESVEPTKSRTLRPPSALIGMNIHLAPQSMMGQFSSKLSSSSQKKHRCKVCDKRFTRPSSLQTHMYSHTGEKPFPCDFEGCGRHFSVLSNLRRHQRMHESERNHVHPSPDD
ncbi:hypothetical protein K469DRAFT_486990, partial [Zopfia rhizophila CBS 207.26]